MQNEIQGQNLIQAFFTALKMGHLVECETILAQLRTLARAHPPYSPWCIYLNGILVSQRDRDWAEAERVFSSLLQDDFDPSLRGRVLMALGNVCKYQGRWPEAISAYEEAASLFAGLDRPIDQVMAWKQVAIAYRRGFELGDFAPDVLQQAISYCERAMDVIESVADPSPDDVWLKGSIQNTLGLIYRNLGQWDKAVSCYEQDMTLCRSLDDRRGEGLSFGNLGEVYQRRGSDHWPEALVAYRKALVILREFGDQYEEAEALANLGFLHQEMGQYVQALDYYNQALTRIEGLRAGISSETARANFFATIADTYANAVLLCLEMGDHHQAFDLVERARSRAFLDALTVRSSELARDMEATTLSLAEVRAALPSDALLIEYFTTGLVEARDDQSVTGRGVQRHRFPPARTVIFAVTRDSVHVHDAGVSPNDLRPRHLDSVVERHFLEPDIRRALYDMLVGPVAHLLDDKQWLYLVPHGPLHYVPFQALVAPDGDTLLREEGPRLIYAPSATLLFPVDSGGAKGSGEAQAPCLAIGYNSEGATRMRFAEDEACSVAQLAGGLALVGRLSKKEMLFDQAADFRLLHFSCHGDFDPQAPLSSALHLAPGETLTALEVLDHLRLRCDLVTLSACESGLSRVRRGDELVGFMRAFMHAGAPALVSTLWRVDECSTRILMERFYRAIQNGMDLAGALHCAQLYLRSLPDLSDPYYWAPFIFVSTRTQPG